MDIIVSVDKKTKFLDQLSIDERIITKRLYLIFTKYPNHCPNVMKIKKLESFQKNYRAMFLEYIPGQTIEQLISDPNSFLHPLRVQAHQPQQGQTIPLIAVNDYLLTGKTNSSEVREQVESRKFRKRFVKIVSEIFEGVNCIHHTYHRYILDFKSSNVMVTDNNFDVKIIDIDNIMTLEDINIVVDK